MKGMILKIEFDFKQILLSRNTESKDSFLKINISWLFSCSIVVEQPVCQHLKVVLLSAKTHVRKGTDPLFPPTLPGGEKKKKRPARSCLLSVSNWHISLLKSNWLEQRPLFEQSALSGPLFYLRVLLIHSFFF